jgi:hypothetical protein
MQRRSPDTAVRRSLSGGLCLRYSASYLGAPSFSYYPFPVLLLNIGSCTFSLRINWIDVSGAQVRGREERELLPDTMMPHRRCSRFTRSGGRGGFSGSPQPRVLHRSLWLTVPAAGATAGRETGARPARTIPDRSARPPSPAYMDANVWLSPCLLWAEGEPAARVSCHAASSYSR